MSVEQVIQGCLRNDKSSQEELFRLFSGKMLIVCMRYARHRLEAEDILQDGFVKAFTKLEQFKTQGSFEYWLRRIMVNTALKNCRRSFYKNEILTGDSYIKEEIFEPQAYSNLGCEELMSLIKALPDGYRTVFNMYAIEGYSHADIAKEMGIQESTSRSQLVKARKILQRKLQHLKKSVA